MNSQTRARKTHLVLELIELLLQSLQLNSIQFHLSGNLVQKSYLMPCSYGLQGKARSSKEHKRYEQNGNGDSKIGYHDVAPFCDKARLDLYPSYKKGINHAKKQRLGDFL